MDMRRRHSAATQIDKQKTTILEEARRKQPPNMHFPQHSAAKESKRRLQDTPIRRYFFYVFCFWLLHNSGNRIIKGSLFFFRLYSECRVQRRNSNTQSLDIILCHRREETKERKYIHRWTGTRLPPSTVHIHSHWDRELTTIHVAIASNIDRVSARNF